MTALEQVRFLYPWPPKKFMGHEYDEDEEDDFGGELSPHFQQLILNIINIILSAAAVRLSIDVLTTLLSQ